MSGSASEGSAELGTKLGQASGYRRMGGFRVTVGQPEGGSAAALPFATVGGAPWCGVRRLGGVAGVSRRGSRRG